MKTVRIVTHAVFLGSLALFCILLGFGVYTLLRPANQIVVQASAAALLALAGYLGFVWLLGRLGWADMRLRGWREAALTLLGALLFFPLLFYPLHYATQGYLARFSNVLATWAFELPVIALALWLAARAEQQHG